MAETMNSNQQVSSWLAHIRALAVEIGPRGPTTEAERRGAMYAKEQFLGMGLTPRWEEFKSAKSIFLPHVIGAALMLSAFLIFPLGGKLTAVLSAVISIVVIVNELLELSFQPNLIRWIVPKGESQNVSVVIDPEGEHKLDLILVGHLDSQRTPIFFRSPRWVKVYDRFTTLLFITYLVQAVLFSLSIFFDWTWAWYASIPTAICALIFIGFFIEADLSPFTAGANDNASAAGLVLTLAEEFSRQPLKHTRVFAVCTGCEETQHYGMIDWYRRHLEELYNPKAIVFEMLGVDGPAYLTQEGIIVPFKSDKQLVSMAERLGAENPDWQVYPVKISGGNTEMADAIRNKIPAICLFGMSRDGTAPYWHQVEDTFDKMIPAVMEKTWSFVRAFIDSLDV
ncbi:MAG TPA: M28 family peptidase [Anaerolineales bacterium]|nr:M28 family peptidase [Anaerolineales bacterium]